MYTTWLSIIVVIIISCTTQQMLSHASSFLTVPESRATQLFKQQKYEEISFLEAFLRGNIIVANTTHEILFHSFKHPHMVHSQSIAWAQEYMCTVCAALNIKKNASYQPSKLATMFEEYTQLPLDKKIEYLATKKSAQVWQLVSLIRCFNFFCPDEEAIRHYCNVDKISTIKLHMHFLKPKKLAPLIHRKCKTIHNNTSLETEIYNPHSPYTKKKQIKCYVTDRYDVLNSRFSFAQAVLHADISALRTAYQKELYLSSACNPDNMYYCMLPSDKWTSIRKEKKLIIQTLIRKKNQLFLDPAITQSSSNLS